MMQFELPDVIILSLPRSGTHFLLSCLACHPKLRGRGECFMRYKKAEEHGDPHQALGDDGISLFKNDTARTNIGILMFPLLRYAEAKWGSLGQVRIIHLLRNPYAAALSQAQKLANRAFYGDSYLSHHRITHRIPENRPLDYQLVTECQAYLSDQQARMQRYLAGHPDVLTLTYELLTSNRQTSLIDPAVARTLLNFLRVPILPLTTTLRKTGPTSDE